MTDKKPTTKTRRPVALPRLHKTIEDFCEKEGLADGASISDLLSRIRDAWFAEAQ